jgi:hypothetical protein
MNRIAVIALALFAVVAPAVVIADVVQYNDPAMSFTAPQGFYPVPVPTHDPAVFDNPAVVAAFVHNPGKSDATQIVIRMQNFEGDFNAFETSVENDMRTQSSSDVFIKKSATKLSNGMPAFWQEVTMGSGFEQMKIFGYAWSDGVRGVQLSITGRNGSVDESTAKRLLADVSAVAYPKYRY